MRIRISKFLYLYKKIINKNTIFNIIIFLYKNIMKELCQYTDSSNYIKVDLEKILITEHIFNIVNNIIMFKKYNNDTKTFILSKLQKMQMEKNFNEDYHEKTFKLNNERMEKIMKYKNFDTLNNMFPIKLSKFTIFDKKLDKILIYYQIIDGRHRISRAIIENKNHILAIII